jgi:hypothetical protein
VRGRPTLDVRVECREQPLSADDLDCIGGVWITSPARTLADLVRLRPDLAGDDIDAPIEAMLAVRPASRRGTRCPHPITAAFQETRDDRTRRRIRAARTAQARIRPAGFRTT